MQLDYIWIVVEKLLYHVELRDVWVKAHGKSLDAVWLVSGVQEVASLLMRPHRSKRPGTCLTKLPEGRPRADWATGVAGNALVRPLCCDTHTRSYGNAEFLIKSFTVYAPWSAQQNFKWQKYARKRPFNVCVCSRRWDAVKPSLSLSTSYLTETMPLSGHAKFNFNSFAKRAFLITKMQPNGTVADFVSELTHTTNERWMAYMSCTSRGKNGGQLLLLSYSSKILPKRVSGGALTACPSLGHRHPLTGDMYTTKRS